MQVSERLRMTAATALAILAASYAHAELSAEELAKLAQNPVGNLISVPFQNNTNLNFGPERKTQNILNIQPVIPIEVNKDWRPIVQMPTNSSYRLGNDNWGLGPSFVILHLKHGDPWVYGVLANNVWSTSDSGHGGSYNNGLVQPFLNYNFEGGLYLTSSPILTVDWKAESSQRWTIPLGGGVGKIFHIEKLPVNTQLSAYYNVVKPDDGPNWQIRAQVQLMFPK